MDQFISKHKFNIVCVVILFYIASKLIHWYDPFDPHVWGNVGDWVMIIITGITGLYLILTFNSQQEITRIEQANFRFRVLPVMNVSYVDSLIRVTILKNPIKKLATYHNQLNMFKYVNLYHHYGEPSSQDELMVEASFVISINTIDRRTHADGGFLGVHDEINFFFLDSQNNFYEQILVFERASCPLARTRIPKYIKTLADSDEFDFEVAKNIEGRNLVRNLF